MARVKICPLSGHHNAHDELFCVCGASIIDIDDVDESDLHEHAHEGPAPEEPSIVVSERSDMPVNTELVFPWGTVWVNDRLAIGRDPQFSPLSDQLFSYKMVSRRHAEVFFSEGQLMVRDVGSRNHTYINGRLLLEGEPNSLTDGDELRFSRDVIAIVQLDQRTQADV